MTGPFRRTRSSASERGFTLIELLVVIIILGILAAVVVFAVSGVGDKGKSSAVTIDERTLRTAQEAFCAKEGRYADGAELVSQGFLSEAPEYHNVVAQNTGYGGPCNGWSYSIVETAEANPDSGTFTALDAPPSTVTGGRIFDLIRYPDGRVVALIRLDDPPFFTADVWDPANGLWANLPIDASGIVGANGFSNNSLYADDKLITDDPSTPGNQCGSLCGRILIHARACATVLPTCNPQPWYALDPFGSTGPAQFLNITTSPAGSVSRRVSNITPKLQFRDNPSTPQSECGDNCGKFLITGGGSSIPVVERFAELFDPVSQTFEQIAYDDPTASPGSYGFTAKTLLPNGRAMLIAFDFSTDSKIIKIFDPLTETFTNGPQPATKMIPTEGSPSPILLPSGNILFAGPNTDPSNGYDSTKAQIFRPATNDWMTTDGCAATNTAVFVWCYVFGSLPDGRVLAFGQNDAQSGRSNPDLGDNVNKLFIFDPALSTWEPAPPLPDQRAAVDAVLLDPRTGPCGDFCNKMLIAGNGASAVFTP